jgi:glycosyltransferase involved in cell wall biosynthesis
MPLLSVIVPSYNHERFLAERLSSIYAQDFKDFELIIYDDASTDGSVQTIRELLKDKSYFLSANTTNSGSPFKQWEEALSLVKGKYIWIAESDDSCDSTFVSSLLQRIQGEHASIAFSRTKTIDAQGSSLDIPYWPEVIDRAFFRDHQSISCSQFLRRYMPARNCIPNVSSAIFTVQGFREQVLYASRQVSRYRYVGDWLFWCYLLKAYGSNRVVYDPRPLCYHRDHDSSTRALSTRHKEKIHIEEYSDAVNHILLMQGSRAPVVYLRAIIQGWWVWSRDEYFWRYKPTKLEALLGTPQRGLHKIAYWIYGARCCIGRLIRAMAIIRSRLKDTSKNRD